MIARIELSMITFNEFKTSLNNCATVLKPRLIRKPVRISHKYSPASVDVKSSTSLNTQIKPTAQRLQSPFFASNSKLLDVNLENVNKKLTISNLKYRDSLDSKLKEIEESVKQENLESDDHVKLALNALSNAPYQSVHPIVN